MIPTRVRRGIGGLMGTAGVALIAAGAVSFAQALNTGEAASQSLTAPAQASSPAQAEPHPAPERIWIDKLRVNARIQPVGPGARVGPTAIEWSAPNSKSVGWHNYSGRLGEGKNIVLNGHNNIYGGVFRKLYTLQPGDEVRLGGGGRQVTYRVQEVMILREKGQPLDVRMANAQYIQPMDDDRLTLVSCWPETNNTHRVIVIARPVADP